MDSAWDKHKNVTAKKIDKLDQYHVIVKILFVKPKYL